MYRLHNVLEDYDAAVAFQQRGGRLPPLLVIGDRVVEGYDPDGIEAALAALEAAGTEGGDGRQSEGEE